MKRFIKASWYDYDITKVSLDKLNEILDSATREGDYKPLGKFYAYNPKSNTWDAIDNSDGCAWTEDFSTEDEAIAWLNNEFEISDRESYDRWADDIIDATSNISRKSIKAGIIPNLDEAKFDGYWLDEDKELWASIDWEARNYKDYIVEGSEISGRVRCVGLNCGWIPAKFAKHIRANPFYPPYYAPVREGELDKILRENRVLGPMFDGDKAPDGYNIHNRYETQEVYDALST